MRARDGRARRARSAVWCLDPLVIALGDCTDVGHRTGVVYLTILTLCPLTGSPIPGIIYRKRVLSRRNSCTGR
jgi:hypothetical protein